MKRLGIIALAFALVLGMSQCKKENTTASNGEGVKVPITLNVGGASTGSATGGSRVAVDTETGVVTFEDGDLLYVASNGVYIGSLTYNGTNFAGEVTEPTEGQKLQFYFLGNKTPEFNSGNTGCSVVISDQMEYLPVISYAPSRENYQVGLTAYNATLLNKCALVKFDVTTASEAATCILGMNNKVTVDFTDNNFEYGQDSEGVITLPAGSGEKWAILLPQDEVAEAQAQASDGSYTGTCGTVPAIVENDYLTEGIEVTLSGSGSDHLYVDLGLPSGLLWATCNVGADTPEGYGDYFAWGETAPKDTYNWSTYQYCNGSYNPLTKYCQNSSYGYNGFTDDLTTLEPSDDAATANWGNGWRMPTQAEFQELRDNTTVTWTTLGGVNGRLFTATNGNSLFLPAAGYRNGSSLYDAGSFGNYWSSSLNTDGPGYAWDFSFYSGRYGMYYDSRGNGFTVRPVRSARQN